MEPQLENSADSENLTPLQRAARGTALPISAACGGGAADLRAGSNKKHASQVVFPQLPGYEITDFIGCGGMGDVFRAIQLSTRRPVALKVMRRDFVSEKSQQRFDREVELTARLDHPHIARIYDSGLDERVYFYAMELI